MSAPREWAAPARLEGAELLERAVGYTRTALQLVAGTDLHVPTPCRGWDLRALLVHMDDALAAFTEAAEIGYVDLVPVHDGDPGPYAGRLLVDRLRHRACALLAAWAADTGTAPVSVAGRPLRSDVLAAAGSLEIAVHGWDVARACGADHPLPPALALELLDLVPVFVSGADRPHRFAAPVDVPLDAAPGTRLLATLGRREHGAP